MSGEALCPVPRLVLESIYRFLDGSWTIKNLWFLVILSTFVGGFAISAKAQDNDSVVERFEFEVERLFEGITLATNENELDNTIFNLKLLEDEWKKGKQDIHFNEFVFEKSIQFAVSNEEYRESFIDLANKIRESFFENKFWKLSGQKNKIISDQLYTIFLSDVRSDIKEKASHLLMRRSGLFFEGLALKTDTLKDLHEQRKYFLETARDFPRTEFGARSVLLYAQSYLHEAAILPRKQKSLIITAASIYCVILGDDTCFCVEEAFCQPFAKDRYNTFKQSIVEILGNKEIFDSEGWRWEADAIFQLGVTRVLNFNLPGAKIYFQRLINLPPIRSVNKSDYLASVPPDYVDYIWVFEMVPGFSKKTQKEFVRPSEVGEFALTWVNKASDQSLSRREVISEFVSYMDSFKNPAKTIIVQSVTSRDKASILLDQVEACKSRYMSSFENFVPRIIFPRAGGRWWGVGLGRYNIPTDTVDKIQRALERCNFQNSYALVPAVY